MSEHWATPFVGWAYERGAQGPDLWDCWSFFRRVEVDHFGRDIPILPTPATWREIINSFPTWAAEYGWREATSPRDGDAVFLAKLREPTHVGVWVADLKAVLHCAEGGSVLHDARHLTLAGWRIRGYFTPER